MSTMVEGYAHGGPRDGIKLTAGLTWNGRVAKRTKGETVLEYHPGYYQWDWDFQAWIWHGVKAKAGTPRPVG